MLTTDADELKIGWTNSTQTYDNIFVSIIYTFFLLQPPPLIEYFPVLHYVVSYNTSDNSTVIQTQLSSSISSYTVSSEPGVTYYITVRAVNVVGPGTINSINGEIMISCNQIISSSTVQCHYILQSHQPLQNNSQLALIQVLPLLMFQLIIIPQPQVSQ